MMKAAWTPFRLDFNFEAITSRQRMRHKDTYLLHLCNTSTNIGTVSEVPLFKGLSAEDSPEFESQLEAWCMNPDEPVPPLSSLRFGVESAKASMTPLPGNKFFRGEEGIPINGLIWMGDRDTMRARIDAKLADGFHVLKLKIGGICFEDEIDLLRYIRSRYSESTLELRLDANGSFPVAEALDRLNRLSKFGIHSIEQPISAGHPHTMAQICLESPVPVALDEELIGCTPRTAVHELLEMVRPHYIILKPALCGGFSGADIWIEEAESLGIKWWATSALESNIGLEAIARWLMTKYDIKMPQGLGTGQLYSNNFSSSLQLHGDHLYYNPVRQ